MSGSLSRPDERKTRPRSPGRTVEHAVVMRRDAVRIMSDVARIIIPPIYSQVISYTKMGMNLRLLANSLDTSFREQKRTTGHRPSLAAHRKRHAFPHLQSPVGISKELYLPPPPDDGKPYIKKIELGSSRARATARKGRRAKSGEEA